MTNRKEDHIRHATTDGVFAKVANDVALAKWINNKSLDPRKDLRLDAAQWSEVLVSLVVGLTGLPQSEVECRLAVEVEQQEKVLHRMEVAMAKENINVNPADYSPDHRDALVKSIDIIGDR
jgi:hypothetical protein